MGTTIKQPQPALPAHLAVLRKRVNTGVGIGIILGVMALFAPLVMGVDSRLLAFVVVALLVFANVAFVLGIYYYVRLKGRHGLWTLVIFIGPVVAGLMATCRIHSDLGLGQSGEMAVRALVELSGIAILVFLPRRSMPPPAYTAPR